MTEKITPQINYSEGFFQRCEYGGITSPHIKNVSADRIAKILLSQGVSKDAIAGMNIELIHRKDRKEGKTRWPRRQNVSIDAETGKSELQAYVGTGYSKRKVEKSLSRVLAERIMAGEVVDETNMSYETPTREEQETSTFNEEAEYREVKLAGLGMLGVSAIGAIASTWLNDPKAISASLVGAGFGSSVALFGYILEKTSPSSRLAREIRADLRSETQE